MDVRAGLHKILEAVQMARARLGVEDASVVKKRAKFQKAVQQGFVRIVKACKYKQSGDLKKEVRIFVIREIDKMLKGVYFKDGPLTEHNLTPTSACLEQLLENMPADIKQRFALHLKSGGELLKGIDEAVDACCHKKFDVINATNYAEVIYELAAETLQSYCICLFMASIAPVALPLAQQAFLRLKNEQGI